MDEGREKAPVAVGEAYISGALTALDDRHACVLEAEVPREVFDQVRKALEPFVKEYGMTHLICRFFFPGMPHRHIMRELELIAKEVMPAFQ